MKKSLCFKKLLSLSVAGFSVVHVSEGVAQSINDRVNPALIEKRLDNLEKMPRSEKKQDPSAQDDAQRKKDLPRPEEGVGFQVHQIDFVDATAFDPAELQRLAKPYLDRAIKLGDLSKLAEDVTRFCREKGYLLTRAIVPPQEIRPKGTAKIKVLQGYVDAVIYEGETKALTERAKAFAEKIKDSKPLKAEDLERYLLLLKDLPGLEIDAILKPSATQPHASNLIIVAKPKNLVEGSLGLNNFGSRYIGPYMVTGAVSVNSLLRLDDQISVQAVFTPGKKDLRNGHLAYSQFVGTEGTKVTFSTSLTETKPGDNLKILKMTGTSKAFSVDVEHPFLRSRSESFYGGFGFTARHVYSGLLNNALKSKDKLRIFNLSAKYDVADSFRGITLVHVQLNQGVDGLGSTPRDNLQSSRILGRPDFTKINLDLSRLQALWGKFSLFGLFEYQYSFDPLLSSERFSYGGSSFFRGYTNAPLSGDSGIKGRAELRYGENFSAQKGGSLLSVLTSYQLYGFYGAGTAWNIKPSLDEKKHITASEVGGGLRLAMWKDTQANVEYTMPLRKKINGIKNPGTLFFSLSHKF